MTSDLSSDRLVKAVGVFSLLFVLTLGALSLYVVIDLFGTMHHWWQGNFFSVAADAGMQKVALLIAERGTTFFVSWGMSPRHAAVTTAFGTVTFLLAVVGFLLFWLIRRDIRSEFWKRR